MLRNRVCQVLLETKNGTKTIIHPDISFHIKKYPAANAPADITINGLSNDDILYLTTNVSAVWGEQSFRPKLEIIAGYSDAYTSLFKGYILNSTPGQRPMRSLHMECLEGGNLKLQEYTLSLNNTTLYAVVDSFIKQAGLKASIQVKDRLIQNVSYRGSMNGCVNKIAYLGNLYAWIAGDTLILVDKDSVESSVVYDINYKNGMIGIPEIKGYGVVVRYRMNAFAKPYDVLNIESQVMPLINGRYSIIALEHVGQTRGNHWYTQADCRRI